MAKFHYPWQRFWVDRDSLLPVDEAGFLPEPNSPWFESTASHVSDLADLEDVPCVVLLGEPGSGKTTALSEYRNRLQNIPDAAALIWADLRDYPSSADISSDLFGQRELEAWVEGSHLLWLFLDGLDEGIENLRTITSALRTGIRKLPIDRLRLRITCRTAEWPASFEQDLRAIWRADGLAGAHLSHPLLAVYEITPLRRSDVMLAARTRRIDPETFLTQMFAQSAEAFALKPVTLDRLLDIFQRHSVLPDSIIELYSEGCRILCEETNLHRRDLQVEPQLTARQRLSIAKQIAALTILGNKTAIWTAPDVGQKPESDVSVDDLIGDPQSVEADPFSPVSSRTIKETLESGLFTSRGADRLGWAHQTFGEFLAAQFMVEEDLSLSQVKSLLFHPVDDRVIPQLRGIAAWAASMRTDLLSLIIESDPDVVLPGDLVSVSDEAKAKIVDALLDKFATIEIIDDWSVRASYQKLCHAELAGQLRSTIADPDAPFLARRFVIDLTESCQVRELQQELLKLALDTTERTPDRINAAYAVWRIGDAPTKSRLLPLLSESKDTDPDFELRGVTLQALWPEFISTEEVFDAVLPIDSHLIGEYRRFVHHLPERLEPHDFPIALEWVLAQKNSYDLPFGFEGLVNDILLAAREYLSVEGVLSALARAIWSRLMKHDFDFRRMRLDDEPRFLDDQCKLRQLVLAILDSLEKPDGSTYLCGTRPTILDRSDLFWLIEDLGKAPEEQLQKAYAELIWQLADRESASHMNAVLEACEESEILAAKFGNPQTAVELDSVEARSERKRYKEAKEFFARSTESRRQPLDPPPPERVERELQAAESGEPLNWWRMARLLELAEDDQYRRRSFETDIRALPGWNSASRETRQRILEAAIPYLIELPKTEEFSQIGPNNDHRCIAGYRALRLLLNERPQMLEELPSDVWGAWALTVLGMEVQNEVSAYDDQSSLSRLTYRMNPHATLTVLSRLILERNATDEGYNRSLEWAQECWDEQWENALLRLIQEPGLRKTHFQVVLRELVRAQAHGIDQFIEQIVQERSSGEDQWDRAVIAGALLLQHAPDAGWPVIWPALSTDPPFGRSILESLAARIEFRGTLDLQSKLSEEQLADLYIWLEAQYPQDQDPGYEPGGAATFITARHEIGDLRDSVVSQLRNKGTFDALRQLDRLSELFPDNLGLKLNAIDAGRLARQVSWMPPTPGEILALTRDQSVRLVQSGEQLLDAVAEVLIELQVDLHGESPRVRSLWNEYEGKYRPKEEEDLSDYLKNYLEDRLADRGIVFGREVQIRRPSPTDSGENTDLHIDALRTSHPAQEFEKITVIAEVKGGWNRDLFTAMKKQLVDRYLKDNTCNHGLYVVFWVNCEEWDKSDPKRRHVSKSIENVRKDLDKQALALSADGKIVRAVVLDAAYR